MRYLALRKRQAVNGLGLGNLFPDGKRLSTIKTAILCQKQHSMYINVRSSRGVERLTKKEFLNQYLSARREISIKLDEIAKLRSLAAKVTQSFSGTLAGGENSSRVELAAAKIVDLEKEIGREIDNLEKVICQVEQTIDTLQNQNQRNVLKLRYLNGMKWEQIAVKLNYNYRWILRIHGLALKNLAIESHYNSVI